VFYAFDIIVTTIFMNLFSSLNYVCVGSSSSSAFFALDKPQQAARIKTLTSIYSMLSPRMFYRGSSQSFAWIPPKSLRE
jgi:hypothetical protein